MNGRIETYTHSDASLQNKCGSIVRVTCQSEQGAKTEEFIGFCKDVAKYACSFDMDTWDKLVSIYPDIGVKKDEIQKVLKEKIQVQEIILLAVTPKVVKFDYEATKAVKFVDSNNATLQLSVDSVVKKESDISIFDFLGHAGKENCSDNEVAIQLRFMKKECKHNCCGI